ncbi:MAG: hydrolase [Aeromicrobium sp.]|nr:hydrolase [Aeromicrobium sp.]
MAGMRVALLQLASATDATANRTEITARLAELTKADAFDLVVLPEAAMADFGPAGRDLATIAEPLDGPFVQLLGVEAERLGTTIVAGMFESTGAGLPFNTLAVVGPDGTLQATSRKIHLFDSFGYRESDRLSPGEIEPVIIEIAGRSVGLMTCYDLRFPELGRALAVAGAELLVIPAAWVAGDHKVLQWRTLLSARAVENTVQVVAAAQCGAEYSGHSMAVDPWGEIVAEAGDEPTTITAELADDDVSRARAVNPSLANRRIRT